MFAKEFTHKNGLYAAMHFVKSVIFYLKSVALYKYN